MEMPAFSGIHEYRPLPRWRLVQGLLLLLASTTGLAFVLCKHPLPVSWMGGFFFLSWLVPVALALCGLLWLVLAWNRPHHRPKAFWGILGLASLHLVGLGLSWKMYAVKRDLDHDVYDSRIEYVAVAKRPGDWPDPAHLEVYEVGSGLRVAMSTAVWTDGLHRSLPRTVPPALEAYPKAGGPKPLSPLGQRNLEVLLKTFSLIRFFHPTNVAVGVSDWGRLISQGVRQVEEAPSVDELAKRVRKLMEPYAPDARLLLPGESIPTLQPPAGATLLARWRHLGLGFACHHQPFTGPTQDRSARLAGMGMAWTTLQQFYPYWKETPVVWEEVLPSALQEAAVATDQKDYLVALKHLMAKLKDGHATAYDYSGSPWVCPEARLELIHGKPIVSDRWGSAHGLPLGSEVLRIDGEPVEKLMAQDRALISASTSGFLEARMAQDLLATKGKTLLEVESLGMDGQLGRHPLPLAYRFWFDQPRPEALREVRPETFIVDLSRVSEEDFQKALPRLVAARGIVFDMRQDPLQGAFLRHLRPGTQQGIRMLLPVTRKPNGEDRTYETSLYLNRSEAPYYQGKVVFLAGPWTGSFAETCLEVVAANHMAPIVGTPSAGTDGNFLSFNLPGNVTCRFTGMKVLKADGSQFQGIGIQPTLPVTHTSEALAAGRDVDLERALTYLETHK